jgi:hypothetical protein
MLLRIKRMRFGGPPLRSWAKVLFKSKGICQTQPKIRMNLDKKDALLEALQRQWTKKDRQLKGLNARN